MESLKRLKPILKAAYDAFQMQETQNSLVNQLASASISSYDSRDAGSEAYDRFGRKQQQQPLAPSSPFFSTKPAKKQDLAVFPEPKPSSSTQAPPTLEARQPMPSTSSFSSSASPAKVPYIPFAAAIPAPQPTREQRLAIPTSYFSSPFYTPFLDSGYPAPALHSESSRQSSSGASSISTTSTTYSGSSIPYAGNEMWHRRPVAYPSVPTSTPASSSSSSPDVSQHKSPTPYVAYQEARRDWLPSLSPHPPANRLVKQNAYAQSHPVRPEKIPLSQPATRHLPYAQAPPPTQQQPSYPSISRSDTLASLRGLGEPYPLVLVM